MAENGITYTLKEDGVGTVRITGDVVASIAGVAATEVRGVASLAGGAAGQAVTRRGFKSLSRGVRTTVTDGSVSVDLTLNLEYGASIPQVGTEVQQKVKASIETMTGMKVTEVNIRVADIAGEEDAQRG